MAPAQTGDQPCLGFIDNNETIMDPGESGGDDRRLEEDKKTYSSDSSSSTGSNGSTDEYQTEYEKRATLEMKTVVSSTEKFTDVYLGDTHQLETSAINKRKQHKIKSACRWPLVSCLMVGAILVAVLIGGINNHASII